MLKHLPILLLSLALSSVVIGCTSGDKEAESADADVEMTEAVDGEAIAGEGADPFDSDFGSEGAEGGEVADLGASDLPPDSAGTAADPFADLEDGTAGGSTGADDFGFDEGGDDFAMDEGGASEAPPLEESMAADPEVTETPTPDSFAAEEPMDAPTDLGGAADTSETFASEETETFQETPERSWVPLKKIADQPFTKGGILANAVYIARQGDTIESVSQKIYGMDRSEDLYKVNPTYRTSTLDVGEKVYYNSPIRPEDNTSMKIFYEDMGLAPETYIAQEGDNIRTVSKNLLGDSNSWKEIWSTNMAVESKDVLSAGTQLLYWTGGETPAPPAMASSPSQSMPPPPSPQDSEMANSMPPSPPAEEMPDSVPPPPQDMAANAPPPPPDMGGNEPPPPPPPPAIGSVEPPPPPPPPSGMAAKRAKAPTGDVGFGAAEQQEQVMMIAIGAGLVLTALILFIIIRKKKSRRHIDFNTATQTQIE